MGRDSKENHLYLNTVIKLFLNYDTVTHRLYNKIRWQVYLVAILNFKEVLGINDIPLSVMCYENI